MIDQVVDAGFDLTTCQQMRVDHGFWIPMQLFWPERPAGLRVVPIHVNTVQHPLPSAARCEALGRGGRRRDPQLGGDERVVVIGSGGLSHQLEGERAGFINRPFDEVCFDALVSGTGRAITKHSIADLVELAGSQGVEVINWLAMRGALGGDVVEVHRNYHIPISNTAAGLLAIEPVQCRRLSGVSPRRRSSPSVPLKNSSGCGPSPSWSASASSATTRPSTK